MDGQAAELDSVPMDPQSMALWMYTSGTTGTSKGAVHLLRSLPAADRYLGAVYGVKPGDRLFCSSKLFFAFSLGHILLAGLRLGATAVLNGGWPSAEAVALYADIDAGDLEYVEIVNPTGAPLDLSEWRLRGGVDIDSLGSIGAGEAILVISFNPDSRGVCFK